MYTYFVLKILVGSLLHQVCNNGTMAILSSLHESSPATLFIVIATATVISNSVITQHHMHIHINWYVLMCTYSYIYTHIYILVNTYKYIYTHTYIHTYSYIRFSNLFMRKVCLFRRQKNAIFIQQGPNKLQSHLMTNDLSICTHTLDGTNACESFHQGM